MKWNKKLELWTTNYAYLGNLSWVNIPYYRLKALSWSRTLVKFFQFDCKFICVYTFFVLKVRLLDLKFEFKFWVGSKITNKLAINWQNFTRVRLQLKFALWYDPMSFWLIVEKFSQTCKNLAYTSDKSGLTKRALLKCLAICKLTRTTNSHLVISYQVTRQHWN